MSVLGLNKTSSHYQMSINNLELVSPSIDDIELEKDATAIFQVADEIYTNKRYKL
jgi:hypothetical protein